MASKTHALILILALSFGLSYLAQAHDETPLPDAETASPIPLGAPSPSKIVGVDTAFVNELREMIPKGEEFLKILKKRIDETPVSSPSEKCLDSCLQGYQKELDKLKENIDALLSTSNPTGEVDIEITNNKQADFAKCNECIRDVSNEDPEFKKLYTDWIVGMKPKIEELINKYNS